MIRIAAVDDELHALERFKRMALKVEQFELCGLFETGEQLLSYLKDQPLDAVFLDVEMSGINGLQLSEQILDLNKNIDIIFITAFNQYAVEAFELQAMDYILKPLTEERFAKTVKRLLKNKNISIKKSKPYIQCFGSFQVILNEKIITFKNSKAKEILAFLVHKEGVPVGWEKIGSAVWPEYDAEKIQANFHANTYLLRKRLAEAGISNILESSRGNYRIVVEEVACELYKLKGMLNSSNTRRNEDIDLVDRFLLRGYMEEDGYEWAYPGAAELYKICRRIKEEAKKIT